MNIKNLPMKFTLVALLVALCVGSLHFSGLKRGQDIAGGVQMQFQVKIDEHDTDPETLITRMIEVLRRRLDPDGFSGITLTPMRGSNRIAISMPSPSKESKELQRVFLAARKALLETNISESDLYRLSPLEGEALTKAAIETCMGDEERAKSLEAALSAQANLVAAREAHAKAVATAMKLDVDDSNYDAAVAAATKIGLTVNTAKNAYRTAMTALRMTDIAPLLLVNINKLYDDSKFGAPDRREGAKEAYDDAIAKLLKAHPLQKALIETMNAAYSKWVVVRKPLEDPADVKRLIRNTGELTFHIPADSTSGLTIEDIRGYENNLELNGPDALRIKQDDFAWYPARDDMNVDQFINYSYAGKNYILLSNRRSERFIHEPGVDPSQDWQLTSARRGRNNSNTGWAVHFAFDQRGAHKMETLTRNNTNRAMAILLDGQVYSAPTIQSTISDRGIITGNFTAAEVDALCRILEAGRMPGKINPEPVSEEVFGAEIGGANLVKGVNSAIYGLLAVAVFMLVYYLFNGLIAVSALVLNMVFVLGAMSLFQVELSLPGIAGLILTIGMAVDANVLIFERFREEQERGLSTPMAIKNAYEQAFSAIFDANVTTLLVCAFLYYVLEAVGMNRVRGFAVTLGLGVMFSMFTALVVTRWSFAALTKMGLLKNRITMLRIFPKFNINWMTKRYMFWGISLAFMVMGITSLLSVGRGVFGVEFSAGAKVTVVFNDDTLIDGKLPTDELVRSKFLGDNGAVATYLADLTKELQTEQPKLDAELKTRTAEATALKTKVDAAKAAYDKAQTTIETARKQKTDSAVSDEERSNLSQQFQELEGQYGDLMTSIRTRKERLATLQADIASCKELRLARITTAPETLYVHTILSAYAKNGADVVTKAAWTKAGKSVAWFDGADTNKDSNLDRAELEYLVDNHPASYRVSTSVTNAALIRRVLTHAFGNHLKTRPACSFDFVASKAIPTLGLVASDTGVTQVTDAVETTLKNDYSQVEYTALNNAHVMAVDNVKPKLTVAEMTKRINDIRLQPDFKDASMNPCDVIPVGKLANRYDSFLVLVKPASTQSFDAAARKAFATLERSVLTESLQREEAMVASVHDASYASKTVNLTIIVIVLSWAAIVFYLWLRFGSLQWGLAAVVCLIHDVMIVVGLIAASHWLGETGFGKSLGIDVFKIDLPMVAAILTVIGYSVNDTIVVFDRIRENRGKRNYVTAQCINSSINQTLPRTVLTSLTTLIVLLSMYILGGGVIKSYSFALIAGILFGTYSSVAVASPLLLGFRHALVADMSDANKEEPAGE